MSIETASDPRVYGGWRRRRSIGMGSLTMTETIVIALMSMSTFYMVTFVGWGGAWPFFIVLALAALSMIRTEGTPIWAFGYRELSLLVSRFLGYGNFISPLVARPVEMGATALPGPLEPTDVWEAMPTPADPSTFFGVVHNDASGFTTVTWLGVGQSLALADEADLNRWVGHWNQLLIGLGMAPQVRQMSVTVLTSQAPGAVVSANILASLSPDAPATATAIMRELSARELNSTVVSQTAVSITFDTRSTNPNKRKDPRLDIEEANNLAGAFDRALLASGMTSLRRASVVELSAWLRGMFNPESRLPIGHALHAESETAKAL